MRCAVPDYLAARVSNGALPPGHRFNLYFPYWTDTWDADKNAKGQALAQSAALPGDAAALRDAVLARQRLLTQSASALVLEAVATSPFATGLGLEHPVDNGFAFLSPYGLPYLAGSGVKGVLRRAAEELALDGGHGAPADGPDRTLTMLDVWWLFGFEGASGSIWKGDLQAAYREHQDILLRRTDLPGFLTRVLGKHEPLGPAEVESALRKLSAERASVQFRGTLTFQDVFPRCNSLAIEIMTPHYGDYYQGKGTPHDAGSPNPIPFLAVPAGSRFSFVIQCDEARLPPEVAGRWRSLVEAIFEQAMRWLGFGAKTAIGYGAMRRDREREEQLRLERLGREQRERAAAEEAARRATQNAELAAMDPVDREIRTLLDERADKNQCEVSALVGLVKSGRWEGPARRRVAEILEARMKRENTWKPQSQKKNPEKDRDHQHTLLVLQWLKAPPES